MEFICKCGHKNNVEFDLNEEFRVIPCSNCYKEEWKSTGAYEEEKIQEKIVSGIKLKCFKNNNVEHIPQ